ncbi:MAG: hypothetical protein REJ23_15820 [Brevundimonas sp.]|nr:hypothetical protein [Brevundimonas sp.]
MAPLKNANLTPVVMALAFLAVVCAGAGGLMSTEAHRNLFAAGSGFWLLMLLVPWIFASTDDYSHLTRSLISAAYGALAGLCFGLCLVEGERWSAVLGSAALGAVIKFTVYWAWFLRRGGLWREL